MRLRLFSKRSKPERGSAAQQISAHPLRLSRSVYRQIIGAVGTKVPENGMVLGGDPVDGIVRHVVFDDGADRTGATYSPDVQRLNTLLAEWWGPSGIRLLGFVHSHPGRFGRPSAGDLRYATAILKANPHLERLLIPILTFDPEPTVHAYAAVRNAGEVVVVAVPLEVLDEVLAVASAKESAAAVEPRPGARVVREETFRRVVDAYDLPHLRFCRVVIVGVGGASGFAEDLVRAGVHDLVLLDPDTVSATNLATQQAYRRDLGRAKVEALADRLRDINPAVEVRALQQDFNQLSDGTIEELLGCDLARPPIRTLLCGCTDQFFAQARVNRVGLQFGVPTLSAQVYAEGRGAEVTFTYPGRTPACQRCVLRSRYDAYLKDGYRNTVTSDGTPIGSTTRLNATKLLVALAILHHGTAHPRWGRMLERLGDRSLIQIRLHPDLELPVFDRVLAGDRERIFADDTVWLPQRPEAGTADRPPCPDCGGTGDLRAAVGTLPDTRLEQ